MAEVHGCRGYVLAENLEIASNSIMFFQTKFNRRPFKDTLQGEKASLMKKLEKIRLIWLFLGSMANNGASANRTSLTSSG